MKKSATATSKKSAPTPSEAKKGPAKKSAGSSRASSSSPMASSGGKEQMTSKLQKLFENEVKDIYWAENALLKALPKMAKNATSPELKEALENHLEETRGQIERLNQVFEAMGKKAQGKKCEAMAGLIKESEEIMQNSDKGMMRDAGIISAGQKVEHYEIATYGTLRTFARTLGLDEVAELLEETLEEEKAADEKLTEVAESAVNLGAAEEQEGSEDSEEEEDDQDEDENDEDGDDDDEDEDDDDDEEEEGK